MRNKICSSLTGKNILFTIKYFFITIYFISINTYSQAPGCPNVNVGEVNTGGDASITCISSNCVDISASYLNFGATTSYTVDSIAYSPPFPYTGLANPISVGTDDIWSPVVDLPFDFCFYGGTYNQCLISSNGAITFDLTNNTPGSNSEWSFDDTLPNSNLFLNSIFGIYHDMDPSLGGEVAWELLGSAPCRTLVVSFNEVPLYSCTSLTSTFQMVLYETTNVIEVYVHEKAACSSWNSGNSLIGIQNASGTGGVAPTGRNTGDWNISSSVPEAWRFVPSGADISTITWYDAISGGTNLGNTDSINVCPTTTTTYRAEVEYLLCNGSTVVETDTVTISVDNCPTTIDFDGVDDYVSVQQIMSGFTAVSQMGWVNLDTSYIGQGTFMGQSNNRLCVNTDKTIRATIETNLGTYVVNTTEAIATGQWVHLASIYDGSTLKLYINGEEKGNSNVGGTALAASNTDYTVGMDAENKDKHVDAFLQEIRVFNTALTEAQLRAQVYQPIADSEGDIKGTILGNDISGLVWSDLVLYLKLTSAGTGTTSDDSGTSNTALLYNMTTIQELTAPIPYTANTSGSWTTTGTWEHGNVWDITSLPNNDWAIVQITNNAKVTTTTSHKHLGLLIDSGSELEIQNDQLLENSCYLKIDGLIDLVGESQLIQTESSDLALSSSGYIERDQKGKSNLYHYNFWSSPVSTVNTVSNNLNYSLSDVLKDGTDPDNPLSIIFNTSGYNGAATTPITIADYWIFTFTNMPDDYNNWTQVRSAGSIKVGEGYTMKGTGTLSSKQNYVFLGKPNNGIIQHTITGDNLYLLGNPYASALDADKFINDNIGVNSSINGTLYFWEHWGGDSHYLSAYEGGYASYNLLGGVMAVSDPMVSSNGSGTITPRRYIPVSQGFMLQGDIDGGVINFNNSQRIFKKESTDNSVFIRSEEVSSNNSSTIERIYFNFTTPEGAIRELLLGLKCGLTTGVENGFDGERIEVTHTDCAWEIEDKSYVIQGVGFLHNDLELPLTLQVGTSGLCKFSINDVLGVPTGLNVFLRDKELNYDSELLPNIAVEFNLAAGNYDERFYVVFKERVLSVEENIIEASELLIYYNTLSSTITINSNMKFQANNIQLYNVLGQQVMKLNKKYTDVKEITIPLQVASGAYLVSFNYNNSRQMTKKLIIK